MAAEAKVPETKVRPPSPARVRKVLELARAAWRWARRRLSWRTAIRTGLTVFTVLLLLLMSSPDWQNWVLRFRDAALTLLQVVAALLVVFLVWQLIFWLSARQGTIILPFENATTFNEYSGPVIADLLIAEIQRINDIHSQSIPTNKHEDDHDMILSSRERLTSSVLTLTGPDTLGETLAELGTVGLGSTNISVGRLLMTLKRVWPLGRSPMTISGSLQKQGPTIRVVARAESRQEMRAWEASNTVGSDDDGDPRAVVHGLIREVAYKIVQSQSHDIEVRSWSAFERFTEALAEYQRFAETGDESALAQAEELCCGLLKRGDPKPRPLLYNIGVAYLRKQDYEGAERALLATRGADNGDAITWNALGTLYFKTRQYAEAEKAYKEATRLKPSDVDEFPEAKFAPQPWNGLGNTYLELRQYDKAIDCYNNALSINKNIAYPWNGLGNAYLQQGREDEALKAYDEAIRLDSAYANPVLGRGNVYVFRHDYESAIVEYNHALKLKPDFAYAWNALGDAYARQFRFQEAEQAHLRAIELEPEDPYPWHSLGDTLRMQGRLGESLEACVKAKELDPNAAYAWKSLGDVRLARDEIDLAIEAYKKTVEFNAGDSAAWDALAGAMARRGDAHEMNDVVCFLERAVDTNPNSVWGWNQLGDAYFKQGRYEDAERAHSRAVEINPDDTYGWDAIGNSHFARGQYEEAVAAHRRALECDPGDAYARHAIGNARFAQEQYNESLEAHRQAVSTDPGATFALSGLGNILAHLRQYDEAVEVLEEAVASEPADPVPLVALGQVHAALGAFDRALESFSAARDIQPMAHSAWLGTASVYLRQGRHEEAADAYRKALQADPNNTEGWIGLGDARVVQGIYEEALVAYAKAAELDPHDWRPSLKEGDVALLHAGDLAAAVVLWEKSVALGSGAVVSGHLRLALARWVSPSSSGQSGSGDHVSRVLQGWDEAWARRTAPDNALIEEKAVALLLKGEDEEAIKALESRDGATDDRAKLELSAVYHLLGQLSPPAPKMEEFLRHVGPRDGGADSPNFDSAAV